MAGNERAIIDLDRKRMRAMAAKDVETLESLLADGEYVADAHYGLSLEASDICHEFDPANIPLLLAE